MSEHHTLSTTLVHAGRKKRFTQGAVNPVIQRASSLVFETIADKKHCTKNRYKGELFYGRRGTLTHFALQDLMCEMEGGRRLLSLSLWRCSGNKCYFILCGNRRSCLNDRGSL